MEELLAGRQEVSPGFCHCLPAPWTETAFRMNWLLLPSCLPHLMCISFWSVLVWNYLDTLGKIVVGWPRRSRTMSLQSKNLVPNTSCKTIYDLQRKIKTQLCFNLQGWDCPSYSFKHDKCLPKRWERFAYVTWLLGDVPFLAESCFLFLYSVIQNSEM